MTSAAALSRSRRTRRTRCTRCPGIVAVVFGCVAGLALLSLLLGGHRFGLSVHGLEHELRHLLHHLPAPIRQALLGSSTGHFAHHFFG